jgi:hypothetical protein
MKVSKTRLKQIIKEEVEKHLNKEAMIPGLPGREPDSAGMGDARIDTLITGFSDYMEADPSMVRRALEKWHGGDLEYVDPDKEFQSRYLYPIMLKSRELMDQADGDSKRAMRMVLGLE